MPRAGSLRQKEVINIRDGARLGFVGDVDVNMEGGTIENIVVPAKTGFFTGHEYVIAWDNISQIGDDIILVDIDTKSVFRDKRSK